MQTHQLRRSPRLRRRHRGRLVIKFTGWMQADPLISAGIGLFILPRGWRLLREAIGILLEGTPADVNIAALREAVSKIDGVRDVHDLHVWSLASGVNAMSLHVVLDDNSRHDEVLQAVQRCATSQFGIGSVGGQEDAFEEASAVSRLHRGDDLGEGEGAGGIAGCNLPELAHALELADVEAVDADQLAGDLGFDVTGAAVASLPEPAASAVGEQTGRPRAVVFENGQTFMPLWAVSETGSRAGKSVFRCS